MGAVHPAGSVGLTAAVVGILLFFRLVRMGAAFGQDKPLRLDTMWISPLVNLALVTLILAFQPPQGLEWLWLAAGAALGGTLGWWRGKTIEIKVNGGTGALTAHSSSAGLIFLVVLMGLRIGLGYLLAGEAGTLHLTVRAITGGVLAMALGMIVAQRVEMTLRAVQLLADAGVTRSRAPQPTAFSAPRLYPEAAPSAKSAPAATGQSSAQLIILAVAVFAAVVIAGLVFVR